MAHGRGCEVLVFPTTESTFSTFELLKYECLQSQTIESRKSRHGLIPCHAET